MNNVLDCCQRKMRPMLAGILLACQFMACGGQDGDPFVGSQFARQSLSGTVRSITGSQSEMAGWVLVLMERDTGISRVDDIGSAGNYQLHGVISQQAHTLVLLDPQYRFSAILTYPGDLPNTVRQYFRLSGNRLPTIVQNGPILDFTDSEQIFWESNFARDSNGNLIPDGLDLSLLNVLGSQVDTDGDGVPNWTDPDINGNGIPNWFDTDTDGDGIADIFDPDANGDGILDITQTKGDVYFERGLSYIMVQVILDVQSDGSLETSLLMTAKTYDNYGGDEVSIRGANSLFEGAVAVSAAADGGSPNTTSWDGLLKDDGQNEDGAAGDGIFARKVRLASGVAPQAKQVVFFRVRYSDGEEGYFEEYPFTFPSITTGVIAGSYESDRGVITKSGQPFGDMSTYTWSVDIYDATGTKVFSSQPISGTTDEYQIPLGVLDNTQSYSAKLIASSLAQVPSYPAWIIRSESFDLQ